MIRTILVMAAFLVLAGLCFAHRSSAGFMFGILLCLFAFVAWTAKPEKKDEV